MQCERVRDEFLRGLTEPGGAAWSPTVTGHVDGCSRCRAELEGLSRTWTVLGHLPEIILGDEVRRRLLRRVRRQRIRESLLTVDGWIHAALAALLGVGLSLGLALLVPYPRLVALCQEAFQVPERHAAPYLVAGMAYGVPLALGAWVLRRRLRRGGMVGGLEASIVFLAVLAPFVLAACREFAPVLQAVFVAGMGVGALLSSLAGLGLAPRRIPARGVHP